MRMRSRIQLSTAIRSSIKGYNLSIFRQDLLSAFVVSLIALPLSMGLSIAVGLPPQNGLYTAIVAGIFVPLLGGSIWQVSGPTAAFVVILTPIVSQLGLRGIIWAGIMAGVIMIVMGVGRLGRLVNYIPYPVTTGFTAGIGVVLATLSLNNFFGLGIAELKGEYIEKVITIASNMPHINPYASIVGVVTLILMFTAGKFVKILPGAIIAILVGTLLSLLFNYLGYNVATIGSEFSYTSLGGQVLPGVPPYPPLFHFPTFEAGDLYTIPDFEEFRSLLFPAFTIAILAALESLLSATVADGMAGTKHNPDSELNAIGIGNILSALACGIPATGAIARTATNINNGGKTPLASTMHALFIMGYVLIFAPYISYMPMAALAALLIHTAYKMSHHKQFIRTFQFAPRRDVIVLMVCFTLTVFIDMVAGVGVGMICAAFLLIQRVSELTEIRIEGKGNGIPSIKLPKGTLLYRIRGPLFFGTAEKAFDRYNFAHDFINSFIIDITAVPFIDMTGLVAMKSMLVSIAHEQRSVHIVCNDPEITKKILRKINDSKIGEYVHFHETLEDAVKRKRKKKIAAAG